MNENLNLVEILKDCPTGTKFYTPVWGEVSFRKLLEDKIFAISIDTCSGNVCLTKEGYYLLRNDTECIIFPSKDQRDWSKFKVEKPKKPKFDPNTLQPFDRVLVRDKDLVRWRCTFYSHLREDNETMYKYVTAYNIYKYCIPYNDDTKHLVGTSDEAPEYYRYWED